MTDQHLTHPPEIHARDLTKSYPHTERPALDRVDLRVGAGRVCALLGANGAGKTTLVRVLTTLVRPDSGSATVAGHDVTTDGAEVRRHVGLVGQHAAVDEILGAEANLVLFARLRGSSRAAARREAAQGLERFGLTGVARRPVSGFSGGMRRRLDLAVGMLGSPPVLMVDEPTTGLDPHARLDLWQLVRDLVADGTTVLLTTQQLEEADALADDVVILREGRVLATGTPAELKTLVGEPRLELRQPTLEDVYLHVHSSEAGR